MYMFGCFFADISAVMRRINLITMVITPIVTGQLLTRTSHSLGALVVAGWNLATVVIEYFLLLKIYNEVPQLQRAKVKGNISVCDISVFFFFFFFFFFSLFLLVLYVPHVHPCSSSYPHHSSSSTRPYSSSPSMTPSSPSNLSTSIFFGIFIVLCCSFCHSCSISLLLSYSIVFLVYWYSAVLT